MPVYPRGHRHGLRELYEFYYWLAAHMLWPFSLKNQFAPLTDNRTHIIESRTKIATCELWEEDRHAKSAYPASRAELRCLAPAFRFRHEDTRKAHGITKPRVYRNANDPNDLVLLFDIADIERAKEFGQSQELRETMEKAGVIMPAAVRVVP